MRNDGHAEGLRGERECRWTWVRQCRQGRACPLRWSAGVPPAVEPWHLARRKGPRTSPRIRKLRASIRAAGHAPSTSGGPPDAAKSGAVRRCARAGVNFRKLFRHRLHFLLDLLSSGREFFHGRTDGASTGYLRRAAGAERIRRRGNAHPFSMHA